LPFALNPGTPCSPSSSCRRGRVEHGESPLDAPKREVLEESSLDVEAGELVGVYSKPHKDDIVLFFRASVVRRDSWQPNDEISHLGYFGRNELPEPMSPGVRTRIIDALAGASDSGSARPVAVIGALPHVLPALEDQSGSCRANSGVQRIELASGNLPFD